MSGESGFQVGRDAPKFYEAHVGRIMAPFVAALVAATVRPGQSVLDVACGTGFATRTAARAAGPEARVEGSDLNPAMLAQARSVSDDVSARIQWREASTLDLPYGDDEFDTAICQQGLQFFPDPAAGVREMARVTRPGGRLGVTAWSAEERSPYLHSQTQMLARYGNGTQVEFTATREQLLAWFADERLADTTVELLTVDVDLPPLASYAPAQLKALPWSTPFFALPTEQQEAALGELGAELAEYRTSDGIRVPFSSYLVTATIVT